MLGEEEQVDDAGGRVVVRTDAHQSRDPGCPGEAREIAAGGRPHGQAGQTAQV